MDNVTILNDLKQVLLERFGPKIDKVILFGSRVDGTARDYSDYDVLIIFKGQYDYKIEREIYNISCEICLKYDILIDAKIISIDELQTIRGKQPYIQNALEFGLSA